MSEAFDWEKAEKEAPKGKMIPGVWKLRIVKIVMGKKDGSLFESSKGDPQIMVVFADEAGREGARMYTLSNKAVGFLAVLLKKCGTNLNQMGLDGVTPMDFSDPQIANQYLLNKSCWGFARLNDSDKLEIEPLTADEASAYPKGAAAPVEKKPPRRTAFVDPSAPVAESAPNSTADDLPF